MKQIIKYAVVGIAGYLIGFYEYKYKVTKVIAEANIDKMVENKKEEES